jgi:hypothetical protein
MQSILTEDYGYELQAIHMAVVLCFAKAGIFTCQILFSWLLADDAPRGKYFSYTLLAYLFCCGCSFATTVGWALPRRENQGWVRLQKKRR